MAFKTAPDPSISLGVGGWVYVLECRDGSYYVGSTSRDVEARVGEHNSGALGGYTAHRRPVDLIWSSYFDSLVDAFILEHKLKRWSRAKKEAFMAGDIARLKALARRRTPPRS